LHPFDEYLEATPNELLKRGIKKVLEEEIATRNRYVTKMGI
jgi:hypothetical protein